MTIHTQASLVPDDTLSRVRSCVLLSHLSHISLIAHICFFPFRFAQKYSDAPSSDAAAVIDVDFRDVTRDVASQLVASSRPGDRRSISRSILLTPKEKPFLVVIGRQGRACCGRRRASVAIR